MGEILEGRFESERALLLTELGVRCGRGLPLLCLPSSSSPLPLPSSCVCWQIGYSVPPFLPEGFGTSALVLLWLGLPPPLVSRRYLWVVDEWV